MNLKEYIHSSERNHILIDKPFEYDKKGKLTTLRKICKKEHPLWLDHSIVLKSNDYKTSVNIISDSKITELVYSLFPEIKKKERTEKIKTHKLFKQYVLELPENSIIDKETRDFTLRYQIQHEKATVSTVIYNIVNGKSGRPESDIFHCLDGLFIDFNRKRTIDNIINS